MRITFIVLVFIVPLGFIFPSIFVEIKPSIPFLLGTIMFAMGLSLTVEQIKSSIYSWRLIVAGLLLQFTVMPLLAFCSGYIVGMASPLFIGMLLVGTCPGGTASNVIVYLGKGNVSLSILMTLCSTLLSPIVTPLLMNIFTGTNIEFNTLSMVFSISKVILLPLGLGFFVMRSFPNFTVKAQRIGPLVSAICIAVIIAIVLALNHNTLTSGIPIVCFVAVVLHNLFGYGISYLIVRKWLGNSKEAFTIATEVAMQNSGLAVSLAREFFVKLPLVTLPGALFSLWHNVSGISLAYFFNRKG